MKIASAYGLLNPGDAADLVVAGSDDLLAGLRDMMLLGPSETARLKAAKEVLQRAFGKPTANCGIDEQIPLFGQEFSQTAAGRLMRGAREIAPVAILTLKKLAAMGECANARLAATRELLDRGLGAAAPAQPDAYRADNKAIGKKERALRAAQTAGEGTSWGDLLMPPEPLKEGSAQARGDAELGETKH